MFFSIFQQNPAVRTCDGTYGNKQYFKCDPDSDDWVDDYSKLTTLSKSPKRDNHGPGYIKSILDSVFPSIFKGNSDLKVPQPRHFDSLKIDQRVVTFLYEGIPLRGTVRYTGDVEDSSGHVQSVVGLELVGIILRVMDMHPSDFIFFLLNIINNNLYPWS